MSLPIFKEELDKFDISSNMCPNNSDIEYVDGVATFYTSDRMPKDRNDVSGCYLVDYGYADKDNAKEFYDNKCDKKKQTGIYYRDIPDNDKLYGICHTEDISELQNSYVEKFIKYLIMSLITIILFAVIGCCGEFWLKFGNGTKCINVINTCLNIGGDLYNKKNNLTEQHFRFRIFNYPYQICKKGSHSGGSVFNSDNKPVIEIDNYELENNNCIFEEQSELHVINDKKPFPYNIGEYAEKNFESEFTKFIPRMISNIITFYMIAYRFIINKFNLMSSELYKNIIKDGKKSNFFTFTLITILTIISLNVILIFFIPTFGLSFIVIYLLYGFFSLATLFKTNISNIIKNSNTFNKFMFTIFTLIQSSLIILIILSFFGLLPKDSSSTDEQQEVKTIDYIFFLFITTFLSIMVELVYKFYKFIKGDTNSTQVVGQNISNINNNINKINNKFFDFFEFLEFNKLTQEEKEQYYIVRNNSINKENDNDDLNISLSLMILLTILIIPFCCYLFVKDKKLRENPGWILFVFAPYGIALFLRLIHFCRTFIPTTFFSLEEKNYNNYINDEPRENESFRIFYRLYLKKYKIEYSIKLLTSIFNPLIYLILFTILALIVSPPIISLCQLYAIINTIYKIIFIPILKAPRIFFELLKDKGLMLTLIFCASVIVSIKNLHIFGESTKEVVGIMAAILGAIILYSIYKSKVKE